MNLMRITYADSLTRWCATLMKRRSAFCGKVSGILLATLRVAATAGTCLIPPGIECVSAVVWREAVDWLSPEVSVGRLAAREIERLSRFRTDAQWGFWNQLEISEHDLGE